MAELIRARAAVYGHLFQSSDGYEISALAYNKDLQEDKEGMFDTADTIKSH